MKKPFSAAIFLFPCMLLSSSVLLAAEFVFSGYASIVAGMTMDKNTSYLNDKIGGGVYTDELEFAPESLMALQANIDLGAGLSVTTQAVARGALEYNVAFEWAYITYKLSPTWKVQAGRKGDVLYTYSNYRDVGYSYNQMRLPTTMYSAPFNAYDGVNVLHKTKIAGLNSLLNIYYGNIDTPAPVVSATLAVEVHLIIDDFNGVVWKLSRDWWVTRLGVHRGTLAAISAAGASLSGRMSTFTYITGAFTFDLGHVVGTIEFSDYSDEDGSGLNPSVTTFSNIAYPIGYFTPSISYSTFQEEAYTGTTTSLLETGKAAELSLAYTEFTLKYDFHPQASFKTSYALQQDHNKNSGGDVNVFSFGIDLVF